MQSYDKGREYKAQEDRECDRDENFTTYIKRGNYQRRYGHIDQRRTSLLY